MIQKANKNRVKKLQYFLLIFVSVLLSMGCFVSLAQAKTFSVGFLFDEFHMDRWDQNRSTFAHVMGSHDIDLYYVSAHDSADLQIAQINQMIDDGFDAIIIIPVDEKRLTSVLKRARKHHIKIIAYNKMISTGFINAYVTTNSTNAVKLQVSAIFNITKKGNYILIVSGKNTDYYKNLQAECDLYKKEYRGKSLVNTYVIDTKNINGALPKLLKKLKSKVSGIFTYDDNIANDVISILHRNNIYSVYVTGKNTTQNGIINVINGYQYSTVYRDVDKETNILSEMIIALLHNKDIKQYSNLVIHNKYAKNIYVSKNKSVYLTKYTIKGFFKNSKRFSKRVWQNIN